MVRSNGPMYLRHGLRRPNFGTKFGASVMGIGPYALRGTARRGVVPYGWLRRAAAIVLDSGAQRGVCGAGAKKWAGIAAEIIPKVSSNAGQSLSRPAGDSSLCTREPLGRGMRIAVSLRSSQ